MQVFKTATWDKFDIGSIKNAVKAMGLKRRGVESSIEDVQAAIDVSVMPFQIRFGSNRYSQVTSDGTFFVSVYIYRKSERCQEGKLVIECCTGD